jgi:hypothetical protein
MKKKIKKKIIIPFPSSFHTSNESKKKTLTSTPLPLNRKKKKETNQGAPFPPSHNEYNINSGPYKLQTVKKVTKSNKLYPCFSNKK